MTSRLFVFSAMLSLAGCGGTIETSPTPDGGETSTCESDACKKLNQCPDSNCDCIPEDDDAFCDRLGKNCDAVHDEDNCGGKRVVVCGQCTGAKVCGAAGIANVCALPPTEGSCSDGVDGDHDGLTDCADADCIGDPVCRPPQGTACHRQVDCGNIVNETITNCCLDGGCKAPGNVNRVGDTITTQIGFKLVFEANLTGSSQKPRVTVVRFLDSKKTDGTRLTCAELNSLGNCKDATTRSLIDTNGTLNQVFRNLYPMNFGNCYSGECTFSDLTAVVPMGKDFILYGETWSGARDLNNPTGTCLSSFCSEGFTVAAPGVMYQVTFR